ncbi:MAG: ATP-dependent Clp protease proteolytic subunit, partial [Elusimicrobiota bacterium]
MKIYFVSFLSAAILAAGVQAQAPAGDPEAPAVSPSGPKKEEASPEKKALEKAVVENQLSQQQLQQRLRKLTDEKEDLKAQADLLSEKVRLELLRMESENKKLDLEVKRLVAGNQLDEEKHKKEMGDLRQEKEKLKMANDLKDEQLRQKEAANEAERKAIDLEMRRLDLKTKQLKFEEDDLKRKLERVKSDLDLRAKNEDWKAEANKEPDYLKNPFSEGVLTVTDRRIPLNGPIMRGVADYVTERIHYYNNKSGDLPIFIVIDYCPGGSVMEGYRIVKAMQASRAPIHVVVKSFAASMDPVITTLADHSYAYPNAIILHHQMSTMQWGNMTQLKEQLEIAKEWYRRLADPVAKKIGTSIEGMTKQMYEHNSDGDWEEFADKAVALKWVSKVVHEIRETGMVKDPDRSEKGKKPELPNRMEEKV